MAFSLNKVMLIGNLGRDAETRFTASNTPVTNYSVATTHSFKDRDGNWKEETDWHNIVSWNLSDFYRDALKKGKKFYIEGRISTRSYEDKDGVKKYITEIVSEKLIPLDGRDSAGSQSSYTKTADAPQQTVNDQTPPAVADDLPF